MHFALHSSQWMFYDFLGTASALCVCAHVHAIERVKWIADSWQKRHVSFSANSVHSSYVRFCFRAQRNNTLRTCIASRTFFRLLLTTTTITSIQFKANSVRFIHIWIPIIGSTARWLDTSGCLTRTLSYLCENIIEKFSFISFISMQIHDKWFPLSSGESHQFIPKTWRWSHNVY